MDRKKMRELLAIFAHGGGRKVDTQLAQEAVAAYLSSAKTEVSPDALEQLDAVAEWYRAVPEDHRSNHHEIAGAIDAFVKLITGDKSGPKSKKG